MCAGCCARWTTLAQAPGALARATLRSPYPCAARTSWATWPADVNAMAASIHQMLEAKRTLLLAISHELRSPITRARLNTELLNEDGDTGARRSALLRDLQEMARSGQ
jgi:signal transduction histidine kinase